MNTEHIERYLNSVGRQIVRDSRQMLNDAKGATALAKSIRFEVQPTPTGFSTIFYMDDYGAYLDEGVSGNKNQVSFTDYKGSRKSSRFSYTTKQPPVGILEKWIEKKGLKGRKSLKKYRKDSSKKIKGAGQFITNKSFAFAIAKSIKKRGIPSLSFFQIPLGIGYNNIKEEMVKELALDVQNYLVMFTKNNK